MQKNQKDISDTERRDRLRLIRSENVGPVTYRQLLARYGTAAEALKNLPELARRGGMKRRIKIAGVGDIEGEIEAASAAGARFVTLGEADYPPALAVLSDAPPALCYKGHAVLFNKPAVAIVGARNASAAARSFTQAFAQGLGEAGLIVASGMARGIDTMAHTGALQSGTIAVVAGGVDVIFPPENEALYDQICDSGLVITEMPLATVPQARHFPRRNRIISGLCYGVVVIEAAVRSGSLITARLAGEQGREVFAVPGSPRDPRCKGTNGLIRQGAQLTETVDDVLNVLKPMLVQPLSEPEKYYDQPELPLDDSQLTSAREQIEELLGPTAVAIDELIRLSGLTPAVVVTILLELELAGRLDRHAGGKVSLSV